MKDLPQRLEAYRLKHNITKTDMARLMGASQFQTYYSWIKRNSIPKEYLERAEALLRQNGRVNAEIIKKIEKLTPEKGDLVLALIDQLLADSQAKES